MTKQNFLVVNSFAEKIFGGNPAAVFTNAAELDQSTMQLIAGQMNLVETVFVFPPQDQEVDFQFRYFTPAAELPIAGHPTVAAILALIDNQQIDLTKQKLYRIRTNAGIKQISIASNNIGPVVMMEQQQPVFFPEVANRENVASVLGLSEADLIDDLPIQPIDTGLGHLIVPVRTLAALMRVQRSIEPLKNLCESLGIREIQAFTFQTYDSAKAIHTRNICPREGIEDPGCGVGNGALGAYLLKHCYQDQTKIAFKAEQGKITNMPCVIEIMAAREVDNIHIAIGGNGKVMIKGSFFLD